MQKIKIAILDDYQDIALSTADWSEVNNKSEITVFNNHIADEQQLIKRLYPFEVICLMRERTPITESIITALPNLKLIVSTGPGNPSIDEAAAYRAGVEVKNTGYVWTGAPELTWALLMAIARKIPQENANFHSGNWQTTIGTDLSGKTIGIVGLGNIGTKIAGYAKAFNMKVIAWSQTLTPEIAQASGVKMVSKETLFSQSDFITIHLVLSSSSQGIISYKELSLMKPSAYLINTSRGPLVVEDDLIKALQNNLFAGAAIDVFNEEPLPINHPLRKLKNVLGTPHIGYGTEDTYRLFFTDTVRAITEWMK